MRVRVMIGRVLVGVSASIAVTACGPDRDSDVPAAVTATTIASTIPVTTTLVSPTTVTPTTVTPSTVTPSTVTPTTVTPTTVVAAAGDVQGWSVVNDTVMGGVSSGELASSDDALVFTGVLSLENNGGFASMRSPAIDPSIAAEWSTRPGPAIRVDGAGRTWTVEVRTDAFGGGWIASLPTSPDGPVDVELPWAEFEPVTQFLQPRDAEEPLDPARIVGIAFYLVDGIEGPFRLGVESIA